MEVETRTLEEVDEVVELLDSTRPPRISRVMLDNMAQPTGSSGTFLTPSVLTADERGSG